MSLRETDRLVVALFSRAKHSGYYSMEKVFKAVYAALPRQINARMVVSPMHASGFWPRLFCLAYAGLHRAAINHITGDISFVAVALPGSSTIVTVHDFERLYRLSGIRAALFRAVYFTIPFRHCRYITTISSQIAKELGRLCPWAVHKMLVIPDCIPDGFTAAPKEFNAERPVILQIGTKANKNLESLIPALEGLRCQLHIVGGLTPSHRSLLQRCGIDYRNSVDVSEEDLRKAYAEADVVSFVSTYEGFGLPILEANAVGRPVIAGNLPPMSEVAGQAACLVDPHSIPSIRAGMQRIVGDARFRAELVEQGFENVKRFSASEVAGQFAALYERVARENARTETPPESAPGYAAERRTL